MKKILLALVAVVLLFIAIDINTKEIYLYEEKLSKQETKMFNDVWEKTILKNRFEYFNNTDFYGTGRVYKYKSQLSAKEIILFAPYGAVSVDGVWYTIDPYEEIFDVNRQLERNYDYPVQNDILPGRLYKYCYEEMFGTKDIEFYNFSYETWYVTGDITVKALMEKLGFDYEDETKLVEELYLELANNEFVLNTEVKFENIKLKLIGSYQGLEGCESWTDSCYLVKISE
ncbi:MAG: hypothetical protein ACOX1L_00190 [Erysipelotrichaceae bacterium]|jgi:hypothetical protein